MIALGGQSPVTRLTDAESTGFGVSIGALQQCVWKDSLSVLT